ncbi:MAG: DNA repair protein RecO [Bacteroidetes bacterium]|nr:MAG: DNA repair protein RecO [Bacteroidota bacterium]TAG90042.1 MAG: DNA repair protein RecO [Bacteroidota bacterium]
MKQKTQGIVLKYFKYGDTSLIIRIYTKNFGLQSYLLNNVRSQKNKNNKIALFQPLSLLDLVVYQNKSDQKLHRLAEANITYPYQSIPFDFTKTSLVWLVVEVLDMCLREENENEILFYFLSNALVELDKIDSEVANFPILFLLQLTQFLGFLPNNGLEIITQIEDVFQSYMPEETKEKLCNYFDFFLAQNQFNPIINITITERRKLLDIILDFYRLHIPNFKEIKSLSLLRELN